MIHLSKSSILLESGVVSFTHTFLYYPVYSFDNIIFRIQVRVIYEPDGEQHINMMKNYFDLGQSMLLLSIL